MPQLTFPIIRDGLVIDVLVNLDAAALIAGRASGQSCPPGPSCDVLIGMDVLRPCRLTVDGPGGSFTIDF